VKERFAPFATLCGHLNLRSPRRTANYADSAIVLFPLYLHFPNCTSICTVTYVAKLSRFLNEGCCLMVPRTSLIALLLLITAAAPAAAADFTPLFNGKDFTGWKQLNGKAKYTIETIDGIPTIVGTTVVNEPNSFLCTEKDYSDFILELEFKVDPDLNCGVQFRSHAYPAATELISYDDKGNKKISKHPAGRVYGYQYEIDPDPKRNRWWTGGLYEEAARGWLSDLTSNEPARKAFKQGDWNKLRVHAQGDHIQTWINGVQAVDARDPGAQSGFIGLQVHGVGKRADPLKVMYRNIQLKNLGKHEWKPLWDGKTTNGWNILKGGQWKIVEDKDGNYIEGISDKSEKTHGMFISMEKFSDFTIRLKAKILKGNSGFYFRAEPVKGGVSVAGFQAELDAEKDNGGLYETNGRAWVVQPKPEDVKKYWRIGEWNEMVVSAHGTRIVVHVNGTKTAELLNDEKGRREGLIALQMHGGQDMHVMFKNIQMLVEARE